MGNSFEQMVVALYTGFDGAAQPEQNPEPKETGVPSDDGFSLGKVFTLKANPAHIFQKRWKGFEIGNENDVVSIEDYRELIDQARDKTGLQVIQIHSLLSEDMKKKVPLGSFKLLHTPSQTNRAYVPRVFYNAVKEACKKYLMDRADDHIKTSSHVAEVSSLPPQTQDASYFTKGYRRSGDRAPYAEFKKLIDSLKSEEGLTLQDIYGMLGVNVKCTFDTFKNKLLRNDGLISQKTVDRKLFDAVQEIVDRIRQERSASLGAEFSGAVSGGEDSSTLPQTTPTGSEPTLPPTLSRR